MSKATIAVKLRDLRANPPSTCEFVLPVARLIRTSAYFRHHLTSSVSRHRDGTFRLNYPDFQLFEIYTEWLRSGEILTKAGLRHLKSPNKRRSQRNLEDKARAAYTDYLGAWFLGSWIQDTEFKDSLVSLMIDKMNDAEGYPLEFVRALRPSLVDIVFMGSKEGNAVRRFIFAAIARWAEEEDLERLVPGDGSEQYPKEFTRGLMMYLFRLQKDTRTIKEKDLETSVGTTTPGDILSSVSDTTANTLHTPPPFASPMEERFSFASYISWPTETSSETASSINHSTTNTSTTISSNTATSWEEMVMAERGLNRNNVIWPRTTAEHCYFHEHSREGNPCHRSTST